MNDQRPPEDSTPPAEPLSLEEQIAKHRRELQIKRNSRAGAFDSRPMPLVDRLSAPSTQEGAETAPPSPNPPGFRDTLWDETDWSHTMPPERSVDFDLDE